MWVYGRRMFQVKGRASANILWQGGAWCSRNDQTSVARAEQVVKAWQKISRSSMARGLVDHYQKLADAMERWKT